MMNVTDTPAEELASALTHGIAAVASVIATVVLVTLSVQRGTVWHIVGSAVFGATMLLLYSASTVYHLSRAPTVRRRLRVLDHAAIYLLIAGTYTPFTLVALRGGWGWTLFGISWGLAVAGVIFKLFFTGRYMRLSTVIYVAMGWLAVIAAGPMIEHLSAATLAWLVAGGIIYTAGTAFYHSRRIPYAHAAWHVFVIGGSVCHAIAVGLQLQ